jgi:hypothetical protein
MTTQQQARRAYARHLSAPCCTCRTRDGTATCAWCARADALLRVLAATYKQPRTR